jgi:Tfp pilus assembly major pilin PilA
MTFFLGGIGGHKFYLGKNWQGVLYLLFFWTYIPALVSLVEFVIYACTSSERLNEKYEAKGSVVVIIIVAVVFGVGLIGILAAIALPAYNDYTHKAKVAEGLAQATALQAQIVERYGKGPADMSAEAAPSGPVQRMSALRSGRIVIEFSPQVSAAPQNRLTLTPTVDGRAVDLSAFGGAGGPVQWQCGKDAETTLPKRWLPVACR